MLPPRRSPLFPYTTLFRSIDFTCQIQKPATSSFVSANGPSITVRDLPLKRTRLLFDDRSEEHTSELQSQFHLVCRLLLEKKNLHTQDACLRSGWSGPVMYK